MTIRNTTILIRVVRDVRLKSAAVRRRSETERIRRAKPVANTASPEFGAEELMAHWDC